VDLDLARVRAFVAVVDEGHFGRAAAALSVSQQGLSKRVARLEAELGVRLLTRSAGGISLTGAGRRFLAPARGLLAAGDLAAEAARHEERTLRIDVWVICMRRCAPFGRPLRTPPTWTSGSAGCIRAARERGWTAWPTGWSGSSPWTP
jgi:DNA-binding transcriptional LysR family regulator